MNTVSTQQMILVTPEELRRKAEDVTKRVTVISNHFSAIAGIVNRTGGYWLGEAGEHHRKMYETEKEQIELMLRRLKEHPSDLVQMAANYEAAEQAIIEAVNPLMETAIS